MINPQQHSSKGLPTASSSASSGTILFANASAAKMLGYDSPQQLVGESMPALLDPDDAREMGRRTQLMMQTGERFPPRVYRANRRGGGKISDEISSIPFQWKGAPAVLAFARDVSDRIRVQAQLAMTDRLAALGTLADLGGELQVESEVGRGATFRVLLPAA